jgi:hypothetical protein
LVPAVDRDVQSAEALDGFIDEVTDVILVAHIGAHVFCRGAEDTQLSGQRFA